MLTPSYATREAYSALRVLACPNAPEYGTKTPAATSQGKGTIFSDISRTLVDPQSAKNFLGVSPGVSRNFSKKVVLVNGCFDILHRGHVDFLTRAAELGDYLIVALNSDHSISLLLKGNDRPFNTESDRQAVLEALAVVDEVVLFHAEKPLDIIKTIKPSFYAQGYDHDADSEEAQLVRSQGGKVVNLPVVYSRSTTKLVAKIRGEV